MDNATVVLLRRQGGGRDQYGDPIPVTWERVPLPFAAAAPRMASNDVSADVDYSYGRISLVTGLILYVSSQETIRPVDRVEVDGVEYTIEGEIGQWVSPFSTWAPGQQMALRRSEAL
jgi:hypothetical protein